MTNQEFDKMRAEIGQMAFDDLVAQEKVTERAMLNGDGYEMKPVTLEANPLTVKVRPPGWMES